jgi:HTH-type transcriptional regulator/antitoxin HipB
MVSVARTPEQIGTVIRRARRAAGLSQQALGEKVGIWQETLSKIETGQTSARIGTICDLLAALDLEISIGRRGKGSPADILEAF